MDHEHSIRTHSCGELRRSHEGQEVVLAGWVARRRDHGGLIFVDLRDREGITQCVCDPDNGKEIFGEAERIRPEWPVKISGLVRLRPGDTANADMATGEIEVVVTGLEVLNTSQTPPFPIEDGIETSEDTRLKYRYLDLRRPEMYKNLKLRSDISFAMRKALEKRGFVEVETPILSKSTPEGARDFVVPSRLRQGDFYALPQSPQLFKQLLMISGFERYYQIARCFRDEDLRADRQPEFTQLDVEMSFVREEDIINTAEEVIRETLASVGVMMPEKIERMQYADAMDKYGCDRPDMRFGMLLTRVTDIFATSEFKVFASAASAEHSAIKCINARGAGSWSRGEIDKLAGVAAEFGAKGLAWIAYTPEGDVKSPIKKFLSEEELTRLEERMDARAGDLLLFVADEESIVNESLGALRLHLAKALNIDRSEHAFVWIVNFPMFRYDEEEKRYAAEHHPFSMPHEADLDKIETDPLSVGCHSYDIVMDGYEIGGGTVRIHNADLQLRVLKRLGLSEEQARSQFGFLLEALSFGAPPHGGIALGFDRICMLVAGKESIRDVIAFPKTSSGSCLMTNAPSKLSPAQLKEVGMRLA